MVFTFRVWLSYNVACKCDVRQVIFKCHMMNPLFFFLPLPHSIVLILHDTHIVILIFNIIQHHSLVRLTNCIDSCICKCKNLNWTRLRTLVKHLWTIKWVQGKYKKVALCVCLMSAFFWDFTVLIFFSLLVMRLSKCWK